MEKEKPKIPPRPLTNQDFIKFVGFFLIGLLFLYGFVSGYKIYSSGEILSEICDGEYFCNIGFMSIVFYSMICLIVGLIFIGMSLPWDKKKPNS